MGNSPLRSELARHSARPPEGGVPVSETTAPKGTLWRVYLLGLRPGGAGLSASEYSLGAADDAGWIAEQLVDKPLETVYNVSDLLALMRKSSNGFDAQRASGPV